MIEDDWEPKIRRTIERFPNPQREEVLTIWDNWIESIPTRPFSESWSEFSLEYDDPTALYTDTRVYIKRVRNELRDFEIPKTTWQKAAKTLAAAASIFVVIFMALSRLIGKSE